MSPIKHKLCWILCNVYSYYKVFPRVPESVSFSIGYLLTCKNIWDNIESQSFVAEKTLSWCNLEIPHIFLLPKRIDLYKHLGQYRITQVCSCKDPELRSSRDPHIFCTGTNVKDDHVHIAEHIHRHTLIREMPEFCREVKCRELQTFFFLFQLALFFLLKPYASIE